MESHHADIESGDHDVKTAKRNLNGVCNDLGDLVAKLRPDDEASIQEVKQAFAVLEDTVGRVNRRLNRLRIAVGPQKSPPDQVHE